jgi:hypothetical protein
MEASLGLVCDFGVRAKHISLLHIKFFEKKHISRNFGALFVRLSS